jgi:hypothetical protein
MKNIESINPKLPFKVPEGYFDKLQQDILAQTVNETRSKNRLYKNFAMAVVALCITLAGAYFANSYHAEPHHTIANSENYESYVSSQVDESQLEDMYLDNETPQSKK